MIVTTTTYTDPLTGEVVVIIEYEDSRELKVLKKVAKKLEVDID